MTVSSFDCRLISIHQYSSTFHYIITNDNIGTWWPVIDLLNGATILPSTYSLLQCCRIFGDLTMRRTAYLFYGLLVIVRLFLCFTYSMRYANICIHCLLLCWSWRLSQIESTYLLASLRLSKTCWSALQLSNRMSTIVSTLQLFVIFMLDSHFFYWSWLIVIKLWNRYWVCCCCVQFEVDGYGKKVL